MIVPVIHCLNWKQIDENLRVCSRNGITMVFLINHSIDETSVSELIEWFNLARAAYPDMKIGVNFLQLKTSDSCKLCDAIGADAVWSDYPGERFGRPQLFGGVAFKYQKHVPEDRLEEACKTAMLNVDVITTSGPATGKPASFDKIRRMRSYIGDHKLAVASGVNAQNKAEFDKHVDYLLVASSITDKGEMIIERSLIELINS